MISGVSRLALTLPTPATQPRTTGSAAAADGGPAGPMASEAENVVDHRAELNRQFEVLGLAVRQFSGILARIEDFESPIE